MSIKKFEFEDRAFCICGNELYESAPKIHKNNAWGEIEFIRCENCGSWCQSPQLTLASLSSWFDSAEYQGSTNCTGSAYINYLNDEHSRLIEARNRFKRDLIRDFRKGSKVLEIGCATGSLLSVLQENGCEVTGLDFSQKFIDSARDRYGLDILLGDISDYSFKNNSFDAIILMGTIGNLQNIPYYFNKFHELLVDGGLLIFNFVNADSPVVKYIYKSNFWMFSPSINCFMTTKGCRGALEQSGFHIETIHRDAQQPSLQKLLKHSRFTSVLPLLKLFGCERAIFPFSLPIPSVKLVKAKCCK